MAKKDINETAFAIVQRATGQVAATPETAKAVAGRKGGLKGGKGRAALLNSEQRKAAAKKAALARWKPKP